MLGLVAAMVRRERRRSLVAWALERGGRSGVAAKSVLGSRARRHNDGEYSLTLVARPRAPREHLQQFVESTILLVPGEGLDVGLLQQRGEDVGV